MQSYILISHEAFLELPAKLANDGFAIIRGLISQALIAPAVKAVKERVKVALRGYKIKAGADFEGLMHAIPLLHKTPVGWPGKRFGGTKYRGWMKNSGVGRLFEDWHDPSVVAVQEACRVLAAALHQVPPESLHRVHERCSIKVPRSPEFEAHLDRQREGTFQIVIALTDTKVLLWPGSHQHDIAVDVHKYYALKPEEIEALPKPRTEVDIVAGDVCVMVGGKLVHGSIAVTSGFRIMTYAHYETSVATSAETSVATSAANPKKKLKANGSPKAKKKAKRSK